ncbi:hypothetical protein ONZ45_g10177 [Pleurotus djamor]|nr:hypothetical protein ONZ45_g10177 [Pleurotus djamor]
MSNGTPRGIQVRALPSAFATKATPSVPSAAETYEPLAKSILQRRLTQDVSARGALCCWGAASIWSMWSHSGSGLGSLLLNVVMPRTLLYACSFWVLACLPAIFLRKKYLTATSAVASSPSKTLSLSLSKPTTIQSIVIYCVSALLIAAVHAMTSSDARLTLFVKSRKHPHYLNGRLLFLLCSQIFVALAFTMRTVMLDRFVFRTKTSSTTIASFALPNYARAAVVAALLTSIALPVSMLSFTVARVILLPIIFKIPFVPVFLKPFMAHFLRSPWHMLMPFRYAALLSRCWFLGTTTVALWEVSNALFDHFVPQQVTVASMSADPVLTLISGATSDDLIMKHFAYAELKDLSADDSSNGVARRATLFNDQKYMPNLWSTLAKDGLTLLGRDYQLFLRRGGPAPPVPAAAPAPPPPQPMFPSTPKKLIEKPIYQSHKQSPIRNVIDSLAADGSIAQAIDEAHVPEIFKSVTQVIEPAGTVAKEEVQKVQEAGKGAVGTLKTLVHEGVADAVTKYAPAWVHDASESWKSWWTRERESKLAEACVPNRQLDALIIEVLANLTCASLTEDRYGVVQRDIPKILEAFLAFLSEIEAYQKDINAMYTPPPTDKRVTVKELEESEYIRGQVEAAGEALGVVADALKDGVASIVRTFGDKLLAFKFPPRTANKLQTFMDYC